MDQANVSRLIAVARDGSSSSQKDAKATLLAHFRDYIRLLAHLHMKSVLSAKFDESDIVQETFLQADRAFDQFRGDCEKELAAWLRRIMVVIGFKSVCAWYLAFGTGMKIVGSSSSSSVL